MAVQRTADFSTCVLIYVVFTSLCCIATCLERELSYELNPGCPSERCNDSTVEIIHVRADGPNDTLHHVWSFQSKPTILIALTSNSTQLHITWENFPSPSSRMYFTPQPHYSFGVLINQVFEFDDADDTGVLNTTNFNSSYVRKVEMPDTWVIGKSFEMNRDSALLVMEGSWRKSEPSVKDGLFRVELETFRKEGHGSKLPHLLHSPNATQMEISLLNMVTNSGFNHSRFVVELIFAANESVQSNMVTSSFKSLDDERTPGVFTLVDLQTPVCKSDGSGGYLQWRPVAYVAEIRDIVNSTESAFYSVQNLTGSCKDCEGSLFSAFFGTNLNTHLVNAINISFGTRDDGFYAKNNASIWTATIGFGHPPDENFSLLVMIIMGTCLGLPAVLIALSGLYVSYRSLTYWKNYLRLT